MMTANQGKKDLNFELNLLPVFDILSCCICFLLMSVAWIQIGSLNANQALGAKGQEGDQTKPAIWAYMNPGGEVVINAKNTKFGEVTLHGVQNQIDWPLLSQRISGIHQAVPSLSIALIMPTKKSAYQDIVKLMDIMKTTGVNDVGISPL